MNEPLNQFINTGLDDKLAKSFNRAGLVQMTKTVSNRYGTHTQTYWVKPQEAAAIIVKDWYNPEATRANKGKPVEPVFLPLSDPSRACTAEQVVEHYKRSGATVPFNVFVKAQYFVSDGVNSTTEVYVRGDSYTPQRQKLHNKIVHDIMADADTAKDGERPICYLLGGGSGSGKSTVRRASIGPAVDKEGIRVATVDADDIKTRMPEYKPFQDQLASKAAVRVHKESGDITNQAINSLIKARKHFIYDGTMARTGKYTRLVEKLQEAGYEVRMVVVTIPVELAKERAAERAKKENREVPNDIIENTHGGCSITYPEIAPLVDHFELWDNSGDEPVLIQEDEETYDEDAFEAFIQKGEDWQAQRAQRTTPVAERRMAHGA